MTISSVDRFVNVEVALRTFSIVLNRPLLMVLELLASLQLLLEDTKRGELDAKDATDDVGSIENEETIDWETVKVLKVKLDIFDDERYKEEVRSAMKLVDVDVIAVDDSGEELISLKGILGETESVELVTTVEESTSMEEGISEEEVITLETISSLEMVI